MRHDVREPLFQAAGPRHAWRPHTSAALTGRGFGSAAARSPPKPLIFIFRHGFVSLNRGPQTILNGQARKCRFLSPVETGNAEHHDCQERPSTGQS